MHVAIGNTSTFFFYIGLGFNIAASVFIGNEMGGGRARIREAKNFMKAALLCIFMLILFEQSILYRFDQEWA